MKMLAILLTIALLFSLFTGCQVSPQGQSSEETTEPVLGIEEEKIYCTAALEDDFADNRVLIVLTNIASLKLKTYTPEDFPEIQCASVSDLSTATKARVEAKLKGEDLADTFAVPEDRIVFSDFYEEDIFEYNQILCLELPNPGKQNVLDAIKELEKREDVLAAEPDYPIYLID